MSLVNSVNSGITSRLLKALDNNDVLFWMTLKKQNKNKCGVENITLHACVSAVVVSPNSP